jgi:hypothetical protein
MGEAGKKLVPISATLSLTEMYTELQRRNTAVLPEKTKAAILDAYRAGRLPLTANEVRELRRSSPVRPSVWVPSVPSEPVQMLPGRWSTPALFEVSAWKRGKKYLFMSPQAQPEEPGWHRVFKVPEARPVLRMPADQYIAKLRETRIVGFLPAPGQAGPPPITPEPIISHSQPIPADIPRREIRFYFESNTANWCDQMTGAITEFRGIMASREAFDREWPPKDPLESRIWAKRDIQQLLANKEIAPDIGLMDLAHVLLPRMKAAVIEGRVRRATTDEKALTVSLKRWKLHSGKALIAKS